MIAEVDFRSPDAAMAQKLLPVARRIFSETFCGLYGHVEFEAFCDAAYSPGGSMAHDLASPDIDWLVAVVNGEPVGYAKLTPLRAPAHTAAPRSLELQQIYVLSGWHGSGVANKLMEWSLETARAKGAPELYLTVFDHNERAKRFYTRFGFREVGRCTFQLGDRVDDDRIWRRILTANTD